MDENKKIFLFFLYKSIFYSNHVTQKTKTKTKTKTINLYSSIHIQTNKASNNMPQILISKYLCQPFPFFLFLADFNHLCLDPFHMGHMLL